VQPNVFFLDLDSFRADRALSSLKSNVNSNLSKIIQKGTLFSKTISAADGTIISLNATFNSQFPFRTGTRAEKIFLPENNYFSILKQAGYHIYGFVPNTLAFTKFLTYCENDNAGYYYARERKNLDFEGILESLGEKIIELLKPGKMKEPWFFFSHTIDLHYPLKVPKEFDSGEFGDSQYDRVLAALDPWLGKFHNNIDESNTLTLLSGDHGALIPFEEKGMRDYEPELKTSLDVGKKIMPKATHKLGAKMIVGLRNKIRDSRLKKANKGLTPYQIRSRLPYFRLTLFDEAIRVPLLFIDKDVPKKRILRQVTNMDIFPTIFEIIGINDSPKGILDGRSLVPFFSGKEVKELPVYLHTIPYVEESIHDKVGIRTSKYKYFRHARQSDQNINLYDLENDPQENINIAEDNPEIVTSMEKILEEMTKDLDVDEDNKIETERLAKINDELKLLGYKKTWNENVDE